MKLRPAKLARAFLGGLAVALPGSAATTALLRLAGIDCDYFEGMAAWLLTVIVAYSVREAASVLEAID